MRRLVAVLLMMYSVGLTGCTATSALSAATSALTGGGGATAQVGMNNTKQGIGATVSTEDKNETNVDDSTVGTLDSSKGKNEKAQSISTGSITAERIIVKNSDPLDQIWSFVAGAGLMLLGAALFVWAFLGRRKQQKEASDAE